MAYIRKKDTDGSKPLLLEGELGYDKFVAGADVGRVYVGTGTSNLPLAQKSETDAAAGRLDIIEPKLATIEPNAKDDQSAFEVPYSNTTSGLLASDLQGAVDEVEGRLDTAETKLGTIETNAKDDQLASEVPITPVGGIASNNVQAALEELDSDKLDKVGGTVSGNLTVTGDLTVQGSAVQIDSQISTADTVIVLNDGEVGAGVTAGFSGIEIERGTAPNYQFGFNEASGALELGESTSRQVVATREDTPTDGQFAKWNSAATRFDTAAVDWTDVQNKPATATPATQTTDGLMSSVDKTKLDGIEAGATGDQTATEIRDLLKTVDGSGSGVDADTVDGQHASDFASASHSHSNYMINNGNTSTTGYIEAEGFVGSGGTGTHILAPHGAHFATSVSTITGAIKITLPTSWTSTMLRFTVKVFEYSTGESFDIVCAGYNYNSGYWVNTTAYILGDPHINRNFNVRFGHDGSKCCVYIGETGSTWSYPQVAVTEFYAGYSNYAVETWNDNWAVSFATSLGTITTTHTNNEIGRYVDGNTVWHAGNFAPANYMPLAGGDFDATPTVQGNGVWHEGNVGSKSPAHATYLSTLDLNTVTTPGFYYQHANVNTPGNNYPTNLAGSLLVQKSVGGCTQIYITYNDGQIYTRTYYSGWSAWKAYVAYNSDGSLPSITTDGHKLSNSTDRPGLLRIENKAGGDWSGIQIGDTNDQLFSFMTSGASGGLYNDSVNQWILSGGSNGAAALYYQGNIKLTTTASGVNIGGTLAVGSNVKGVVTQQTNDASYTKVTLTNGLMLISGQYSSNSDNNMLVTFAGGGFPSACCGVWLSVLAGYGINAVSKSNFYVDRFNANDGTFNVRYFAIGY